MSTTELLSRKSPAGISSLDVESRTVDIVIATETPVRRADWDGQFDEVLEISANAVDPTRLDSLPLLDSHRNLSMDMRLGSILPGTVRIVGGELVGTVKLSRSPAGERILQDLADGHRLSVSVGYKIHKFSRDETSDIPVLRATRWEPFEVSAVCIPADPEAKSRSLQTRKGQGAMSELNSEIDPVSPSPETRAFDAQQRQALAERHGLDDKWFKRHSNMSDHEFRGAILNAVADRQEANETFPYLDTRPSHRDANRLHLQVQALAARAMPSIEVSSEATEFRGYSYVDHARTVLETGGVSTRGMAHSQIIERALHTTSDFPRLLGDGLRRVLRDSYVEMRSDLRLTARQSTAPDFRARTKLQLSESDELLKVNEAGEFTYGSFDEAGESYKIDTFGRIFSVSRQALVNDDLSAFTTVMPKLARAAGRFEDTFLSNLVSSNPIMSDGKAVFHADHGNLAESGGALSVSTLSAARLAMRKQVGLKGERVNVIPMYLVVPSELETIGEQVLAEIAATKVDDVNVFSKKLQLIVDPYLEDETAWYLAAQPGQTEGLEYAYLEGAEGPVTDTRAGFEIDGLEVKVRLDFGGGWIDHRGWFKNPGA
ncbi:MAG: Mu-like prophage major head subunit gpT family protein [Nitratireductor sp.]|nr:Mu-like prophage major head subunit gpT family protein [Nitratireductor sp.]